MDNNMGTRIRQLRKTRGITIKKLSERLNLSMSYLGLIEGNRRNLSSKNLAKLADIFNVTVDYLMFGTDAAEHGETGCGTRIKDALSQDEREFITAVTGTVIFYRFTKSELDFLEAEINLQANNLQHMKSLYICSQQSRKDI